MLLYSLTVKTDWKSDFQEDFDHFSAEREEGSNVILFAAWNDSNKIEMRIPVGHITFPHLQHDPTHYLIPNNGVNEYDDDIKWTDPGTEQIYENTKTGERICLFWDFLKAVRALESFVQGRIYP